MVRFSRKKEKKRVIVKVPFEECEARFVNHGLMSTTLTVYHPKEGWILGIDVSNENNAQRVWSFLVQYMDKEAPLPDTGPFAPYANRTKGLGSVDEWEEIKRSPGFIDPLAVWREHLDTDPPEEFEKIHTAYSPRRMPVTVTVAPEAIGEHLVAEPRDKTTPLPKQVMRPFECSKPVALNQERYIFKYPNPACRYHYLANWGVLCAGIAMFIVNTMAALGTMAAAMALFFGIRHLQRNRGTILDRKKALAIFHQGMSFSPHILPFDECEGQLVKTVHEQGFNSYRLHLQHPVHGNFVLNNDEFLSLDILLSFWSFIVQYMDKNAPLPLTKETEHFENTTAGVGPWDKWAKEAVGAGFIDPFAQWLQSLSKN